MRNNNADPYNQENRSNDARSSNRPNAEKMDLTDSPRDQERLKPDEGTIELPDVKDIPGQEFVNVPPLGMMADTTISSADEEGEGIFVDDEEDETDIEMGTTADISDDDKRTLQRGDDNLSTNDDERLRKAALDDTDFEGEKLNEGSFGEDRSGADLDIPESSDESKSDAMNQGDEENDFYSLGSADNDNVTEGTP